MKKYRWNPPMLHPGDTSEFYDHRGSLRTGKCMRVSTWYRNNGEAMHTYAMRIDGRARNVVVGDDSILRAAA